MTNSPAFRPVSTAVLFAVLQSQGNLPEAHPALIRHQDALVAVFGSSWPTRELPGPVWRPGININLGFLADDQGFGQLVEFYIHLQFPGDGVRLLVEPGHLPLK